MTGSRRRAAALPAVVVLAAATGCTVGSHERIPGEICEIPVSKAALAPLIPEDGKIRQTHHTFTDGSGGDCRLSADRRFVLVMDIVRWDNVVPKNVGGFSKTVHYAAERPVSFPDYAIVGSNGAQTRTTCTSGKTSMTVEIDFLGDRVENTPTGYKKLLRFVDEFVPQVTKKFGCTA